ncbi:MAG: MlaD family protein [Cyclobacteriaceae bacterium]
MSKEFKIGLLTIIAGGLLYFGFNFLRGTNLFSPSNTYYIMYRNVTGLNVSNPVYYNGLPVGRVSGFKLVQKKDRIVVSLDIDQEVIVGEDAIATLANDGLLGGKAVLLDVGKSEVPMEPGDTLKSAIAEGIFDQFEPITDNLNSTITKINILLDTLNSTDLQGTVDELKLAIIGMRRTVYRIEPEIKLAIQEYASLATSLKVQVKNIEPILKKTDLLMDSLNSLELKATVANLNRTMDGINEIMTSLQSDDGTIGKLMTNDSVYNNLNKLLVDLDELAIHFNNYPKDFLRPLGRKNKKLKGITGGGN